MNKYVVVVAILAIFIISGCAGKNKGLQKSPCANIGAMNANA